MTESIDNYSFDFVREVRRLRRFLGPKADDILFAQVNVIPSDAPDVTAKVSFRHITGNEALKGNPSTQKLFKALDEGRYAKDMTAGSCHGPIEKDGAVIGHIVCMKENESFPETLGEKNKSFLRLFGLYHETGHAFIDGPKADNDNPFIECAADAYAALCLLRRFGQEAVPLLSMISWSRSLDAVMSKNTSHISTTVLDKIIADSARCDFSKLTSGEIAKRAAAYAKAWTPSASMLSASRKAFGEMTGLTALIAAENSSSSSSSLAFYLAAKVAQPLLQPEGFVCNGAAWQFTREQRRTCAAAIKKGTTGLRLRDIFKDTAVRKKAGPALNTALKVSRPAGQKQFTVKFSKRNH